MFDRLFGITSALAEAPAAGAAGAEAAPNSIAALVTTMLPMLLILVVFYFMLIRPQKKKDKQVKEMLNNLKVGDQDTPMVIARWAVRNVEAVSVENEGDIIV